MLEKVINKEQAVPYRRYNKNVGHKKGRIAAGRFPIKASKHFLMLLKSVEANAQNKGLDVNSLIIKQAIANKASRQFHQGRQRRIELKRTHINIVVEEKIEENKKNTIKKEIKK